MHILSSGGDGILSGYDTCLLLSLALSGSGERNILLGIGAGLLLASAVIFFLSIRDVFRALESPKWAKTKGRITESKTMVTGSRPDSGTKAGQSIRRIRIKYEYFVDGRDYIGARRCFSDYLPTKKKQEAQEIVEYYPNGKEVEVYYKPFKPKLSVLEPGLNVKTALIPFLGFLPLIFAVITLLAGYGVIGN